MVRKQSFQEFLRTAFDQGHFTSDDVISWVLPLFKKVLNFHEEGNVAPFEKENCLFVSGNRLDIDENMVHPPKYGALIIEQSDRREIKISSEEKDGAIPEIQLNRNEKPNQPVYLPGYQCYEILIGHHDDLTDIFCLGLIMGSVVFSLDLYKESDLRAFIRYRKNPTQFHDRIHPSITALVGEMTELDRQKRARDLYDIILKLEHYRDFDTERQIDLSEIVGVKAQDIPVKQGYILSKLRNRLFDTSRRNRLLYYKANMRFVNLTVTSVPVVLHYQSIRPELLFTWNEEVSDKVRGMNEMVLNKYLRFEDHPYLIPSLDKIRSESQKDIHEYGFSQLKLVIAFLNWHNLKEETNERIQSPLLLIPVELKKSKKLKEDHYYLKIQANEAEVNPVLAHYLRELYGIQLPEFIDLDELGPFEFYEKLKEQIDAAKQGVSLTYIDQPDIRMIHRIAQKTADDYKKRTRQKSGSDSIQNIDNSYEQEHLQKEIGQQEQSDELAERDTNPYQWEVDVCNMVLGNFHYKKMSLVRDYSQVIDASIQHRVFDQLFSDQPRNFKVAAYDVNDPEKWYHVLPADPTQTNAILQSRENESYVIQGPPGTGKSQTITNLIADYVARGKTVLFVCEKRAALDVVYYRLKQLGLDELCCYIHDSQNDKRSFIKNLKDTYENFMNSKLDLGKIKNERSRLLEKISDQIGLLKNYHFTNSYHPEAAGSSVRELIKRIIELKSHYLPLRPNEEEILPDYKEWKEHGEMVHKLYDQLKSTGAEGYFALHPLSKIKEGIFLTERPISMLQQLVNRAIELLSTIEGVFDECHLSKEQFRYFYQVRNLIEDAVLLHPVAENNTLLIIDPTTDEGQRFESIVQSYKQESRQLREVQERNMNWKNKFSEPDTERSLEIASQYENAFLNFFSTSWRRLKKQMNEAYDFSKHPVRPTYTSVLEQLKAEYELQALVNHRNEVLDVTYKIKNLDAAWLGIERIRAKRTDPEVDYLLRHPNADQLVRRLYQLNNVIRELDISLKQLLFDHDKKMINVILDELDMIHANSESLSELLPTLQEYAAASGSMKKALRQLQLTPDQWEVCMALKTLKHIYQNNKDFEKTDHSIIEQLTNQLKQEFTGLYQQNSLYIRAKVRDRFERHMELSNKALTQLNNEEKEFKKEYAEGRKILENEFSKTMRYKSIRHLASKESGKVLSDLKPVWLMSPLSVSDSLPVDRSFFDVVIFDEASQIPLEDGVPALYRAPQTIVVGDDKQMPPTNFFNVRREDPDDLEQYTDEEDEWLSNDLESLLVQATKKLNNVMLGWHYRSRYETLINYSNHAFYSGNLLTIPDRVIHHGQKQAIEIKGSEDAEKFISALTDRSISFHHLTKGVYEKRVNEQEASYIAEMIRILLKGKIKDSIGIVAFSQEQQQAIEDALYRLSADDKEFEQLLEEAFNRTDHDQFTGLFVKNLENVQGDERDLIIMSICYGYDSKKRMIMNFGPVNKKGGEKRLNVIFSRAKKHMAVVSSITHSDITNEYNEGANYFKQFLNYAEQVSIGNMEVASRILDKLILRKSRGGEHPNKNIVRSQIKEELEKEGLEVAEEVGQSRFRCSLAVRVKPQDEFYALSILIDDEDHYRNENLLEQYYQRPDILKEFGWRTVLVFTKDWLHHPQKVMSDIKKILLEAGARLNPGEKSEIYFSEEAAALSTEKTSNYESLSYERLEYKEDNVDKFWEVAVDQQRLIIRSGRTGLKGQTIVRRFTTKEAAEGEMRKMLEEKRRKLQG